jgi:O-acetyl-ADP-ribose deacetylase (regulator of RNase III)
MFVYKTNQIIGPKYIINFPTKKHWKNESKIEDIEAGLKDLLKIIEVNSIKSIAIPPLGSGLGGLNWNIVKQKIEEAFKGSEIKVIIYEPLEIKSKTKTKTQEIPKMTPGRAALIELANQY